MTKIQQFLKHLNFKHTEKDTCINCLQGQVCQTHNMLNAIQTLELVERIYDLWDTHNFSEEKGDNILCSLLWELNNRFTKDTYQSRQILAPINNAISAYLDRSEKIYLHSNTKNDKNILQVGDIIIRVDSTSFFRLFFYKIIEVKENGVICRAISGYNDTFGWRLLASEIYISNEEILAEFITDHVEVEKLLECWKKFIR